MNVYVASSWRNERQPAVVRMLRAAGHEVYDFKEPTPGDEGFRWTEIDPEWQSWSPAKFREALEHPIATQGRLRDMAAMRRADAIGLVMPAGRSAHLELGYGIGADKVTAILLEEQAEPELMHGCAGQICLDLAELVEFLRLREQSVWRHRAPADAAR